MRLGIALNSEFCWLINQAPEVSETSSRSNSGLTTIWSWSRQEGAQPYHVVDFWQHPWVTAITANHSNVWFSAFAKTVSEPAGQWGLPSSFRLRRSLGLCTVYQGRMNGLVILGLRKKGERHQHQAQLRPQLSVINALLPTSALKPVEPSEHPASVSSLTAHKAPVEESPIIRLWYDATRHQLDQQRKWNEQLIHNIVTIMSDQTRNPLATMRMGIEILRKSPLEPEQLEKRLAILEGEWRKLNAINEKILRLRTLKSNQDTVILDRLPLQPILASVIQEDATLQQAPERLRLHHESALTQYLVDANPEHLRQILQEILTNAQKFSPPNSEISLTLGSESGLEETYMTMTWENTILFPVTAKPLKTLSEPFYREQPIVDSAIPGIGLGLTIIAALVEQLNGRLEFTVKPVTGVLSGGQSISAQHFIVKLFLSGGIIDQDLSAVKQ